MKWVYVPIGWPGPLSTCLGLFLRYQVLGTLDPYDATYRNDVKVHHKCIYLSSSHLRAAYWKCPLVLRKLNAM
ncbi:hypothetical protein GGR52DRAFT_556995 [Hypoxylon sp. FL1284]|nr:hypothetical protein GGR52DRAFT_556995 [Hypoxylon sp. FL1284]